MQLNIGCTAFTRFFKHQSGFPKFKKKDILDVKDVFCKRIIPKTAVVNDTELTFHPWLGETKRKEISANIERWLADSKQI